MRHVWMLLLVVGCGRQNGEKGFLGESDGTIVVQGTERRFDGGALEFTVEGERFVVVTTHGWHFSCEWAEGEFSPAGGSNIDRQGTHWDLVWSDALPDQVVIHESKQGLLGGGSGGTVAVLDAEVAVDEAGNGEILTDKGDVGFETFDCGAQ